MYGQQTNLVHFICKDGRFASLSLKLILQRGSREHSKRTEFPCPPTRSLARSNSEPRKITDKLEAPEKEERRVSPFMSQPQGGSLALLTYYLVQSFSQNTQISFMMNMHTCIGGLVDCFVCICVLVSSFYNTRTV